MLRFPGKFDCTRIRPQSEKRLLLESRPVSLRHAPARNWLICLCLFCSVASAQPYPEVAWLAPSSYCNPYFGFRLTLPPELKSEPIFLPVESNRHHMLLALRLWRLDRYADLLISAFEDARKIPRAWPPRPGFRWLGRLVSSPPDPMGFPSLTTSSTGLTSSVTRQVPAMRAVIFLPCAATFCKLPFFPTPTISLPPLRAAMEHLEFLKPDQCGVFRACFRAQRSRS